MCVHTTAGGPGKDMSSLRVGAPHVDGGQFQTKARLMFDALRSYEYRYAMTGRLQQEIKQTKPFSSVEEEVLLNLMRTNDALERQMSAALKPFAISTTQYNVLRILRGAGHAGLPCGEIGERMITRDPDITRLLDRLEKRGLIQRCRETRDRRVIMGRITQSGLDMLTEIDRNHSGLLKSMFCHMRADKLQTLSSLLEQVRCGKR